MKLGEVSFLVASCVSRGLSLALSQQSCTPFLDPWGLDQEKEKENRLLLHETACGV